MADFTNSVAKLAKGVHFDKAGFFVEIKKLFSFREKLIFSPKLGSCMSFIFSLANRGKSVQMLVF